MRGKLQQNDHFQSLGLRLESGGAVRLPDEIPTRYAAVFFYSGYW